MINQNIKKYTLGVLALATILSVNTVTADNDEHGEREEHKYGRQEEKGYEREEHKYGRQEEKGYEREEHKYGRQEEKHLEENNQYKNEDKKENHKDNREEKHTVDFSPYAIGVLTEAEKKALIHMREEEKMARDVYRTLAKTTNSKAFTNIPTSEENHMDAFAQLIDRYQLTDPVIDGSNIGNYSNPAFTKLFNELTKKGKQSDKDAFEVGATIEDINMANLIKYSSETEKEDLKLAYETLLSQSKHHMSAFVRNLERLGEKYVPEHISEEELKEAVTSGKEHMQKEAKEGGKKAMEMEREIEGLSYDKKDEVETNKLVSFIQKIIKNIFSGWFK